MVSTIFVIKSLFFAYDINTIALQHILIGNIVSLDVYHEIFLTFEMVRDLVRSPLVYLRTVIINLGSLVHTTLGVGEPGNQCIMTISTMASWTWIFQDMWCQFKPHPSANKNVPSLKADMVLKWLYQRAGMRVGSGINMNILFVVFILMASTLYRTVSEANDFIAMGMKIHIQGMSVNTFLGFPNTFTESICSVSYNTCTKQKSMSFLSYFLFRASQHLLFDVCDIVLHVICHMLPRVALVTPI